MGEEERKDVANIVSSILTSSTNRMTIRQLGNDFLNTVGYRIPHERFGCNSLEQFLRTLKEKVRVNGSGVNAEIQVVVTDKTAHINELIAKQKTSRPKLRGSYRRNNNFRQPRRNFTSYNQCNRSYPPGPRMNQNKFNIDESISPPSPSSPLPYPPALLSINPFSETAPLGVSTPQFKGAVPKPSSTLNQQEQTEQNLIVEEIYFSDEETRRNMKVPDYVQDNLKRLILKYQDGIICSNVLEVYRKEYGRTLNYSEYGYRSIAEMCVDLRNIFNVVQLDRSDIKLFKKNAPIPEDTLNIVKKFQLMKIKASRETSTVSAIPEGGDIDDIMYEIHSGNIPEDIVPFGTKLGKQWIDPGTIEQDFIDVNVGEIYDPSKFWINLIIYGSALNALMDTMQIFYNTYRSQYQVPPFALKKDMYIVCVFVGEYHRAKVVDASQKGENSIKVYFVDYGTVSVISLETICYLHKQFAELPEQAIRARLAGILPPTENEQWSRAAATRFLGFVLQKDLVAQIIRIDDEKKILDIVLADTSIEEEDFYINDALVSMGYAVFGTQKRKPAEFSNIVPIVRYLHLFPTHEELEYGLVPTATQSICMLQAGMCIEQMYPHYFKDADTGLPISMFQALSKRNENLSIDHNIDQSYYEADEEEEEEDQEEDANVSNANISESWADVIEEVDTNPVESFEDTSIGPHSDFSETQWSPIDSPFEEKATQTISSASTQTDISENDREKSEKVPRAIVKTAAIHESADSNAGSGYNSPSFNPEPNPVKTKPLRPPPGYDVVPRNTSVTYNYTPNQNPNNYITAQTFINFPTMYPYQTQQHPYSYYQNQYYENCIQQFLRFEAALAPEQLNYLRSFNNYNVPNYGHHPQYSHSQPQYPYSQPPGYTGMYPHCNPGESVYYNQTAPNLNRDIPSNKAVNIESVPRPLIPEVTTGRNLASNDNYSEETSRRFRADDEVKMISKTQQVDDRKSRLDGDDEVRQALENQKIADWKSRLGGDDEVKITSKAPQIDDRKSRLGGDEVRQALETQQIDDRKSRLGTDDEMKITSETQQVDDKTNITSEIQQVDDAKSPLGADDTLKMTSEIQQVNDTKSRLGADDKLKVTSKTQRVDDKMEMTSEIQQVDDTKSRLGADDDLRTNLDAQQIHDRKSPLRGDDKLKMTSKTQQVDDWKSRLDADDKTKITSETQQVDDAKSRLETYDNTKMTSEIQLIGDTKTRPGADDEMKMTSDDAKTLAACDVNLRLDISTEDISSTQTSEQEDHPTIDANISLDDISETESVYEECNLSCKSLSDLVTSTLTKSNTCFESKLITSMIVGDCKMHVISHGNDFYFLLRELSQKVFRQALTAYVIRRLIVGTSYTISVVDIRLKTNPKLKNELLMFDLIAENETTVDAIPIKYLRDLTSMMSDIGDDTETDAGNINDLLREVDCFLSKLKNIERSAF